MSSSSAASVEKDPLSVVLGPTDMSDIDSALENLLNDGINNDDSETGDFAIDSDDEGDAKENSETLLEPFKESQGTTGPSEQESQTQNSSLMQEVPEESIEIPSPSKTSEASVSNRTSVFSHPLANLSPPPASSPNNNRNKTKPNKGLSLGNTSNSAVDTIKSFQASVPSMSSVTSSISSLWNQNKHQFSGIANSSSSSSLAKNNSIPTSYSVRRATSSNSITASQQITSEGNQMNQNSNLQSSLSSNNMNSNVSENPPSLPNTSGGVSKLVLPHIHSMLAGERIIMFLSNIKKVAQSSDPIPSPKWWCCAMTLYRIILFPYSDGYDNNTSNSDHDKKRHVGGGEWIPINERESSGMVIQMPLASMDYVERIEEEIENHTNEQNWTLVIHGKDNNRFIRFTTSTVTDSMKAHQTLNTYAFPGRRNIGYLFAFESRRSDVLSSNHTTPPTHRRFQFTEEFETRLKILPSIHYTKIENVDYGLCGSYPRHLIVPRICGNGSMEGKKMLRKCAAFRSEQRLPALTWARGSNSAGIWRCSQPKVGIQGNRSAEDERYVRMMGDGINIRRGSGLTSKQRYELTGGNDCIESVENLLLNGGSGLSVKILDMRSKTSAMGNRGTGYGYETANNYTSTSISFCGITNIHGVRDAYNKLSQLCLNVNTNDVQWGSLVEDTKWLSHIRLVLQASWITAFHIHYHNLPVLVHCSHGWDRTSQVAAIAQLFLDPYYRTFDGFATLVEKDFMAFGHPFHTRAGHGEGKGERGHNGGGHGGEGQVSPIFIQYLDCVWQIVQQFPNAFEFNVRYLLMISEHVYSCRFGTFLCDNEKERELDASVRQRTYCLWDNLDYYRNYLINDAFRHDDQGEMFLPPLPLLLRNVKVWGDRFLKWSPKPSWLGIAKDMRQFLNLNEENEVESKDGNKKDEIFELRCATDVMLSELRKERQEKEKWKKLAEMYEEQLSSMKN